MSLSQSTPTSPPPSAAVKPTGRTAPTQAPENVDPAVQTALERVEPAPGYALARLVLAAERHEQLGFPERTEALLDSAMLRLMMLHSSDDLVAADYPVGSIVFASLEGLAPLLGTYVYLLPLERIQGQLPQVGSKRVEPFGFQN